MLKNDSVKRMSKWIMITGVGTLLLVAASLVLTGCSAARPVAVSADALPGQPQFKVVGLGVNPSSVGPGEAVAITAKIVNTGNADGIYNARLKVNGIVEAVGDISIPAGGSREVNFNTSKDLVQEYTVTLGEMAGGFAVVATQAQDTVAAGSGAQSGLPPCCQTGAGAGTSPSISAPSVGASCCGGSVQTTVTQRRSCCGQ